MKKNEEITIAKKITEYCKNRKLFRTWTILVGIMAIFVVAGVGIGLRYIGQALAGDETVLCCELEEHVHASECYKTNDEGKEILVCSEEEHMHDDKCYAKKEKAQTEEISTEEALDLETQTEEVSAEEVQSAEETSQETETTEETAETTQETLTEQESTEEAKTETKTQAEANRENTVVRTEVQQEIPLTITKVTISDENYSIKYEETTDTFNIKGMKVEFSVDTKELIEAGYKGYYQYPKEIIIQDELLNNEYALMRGTEVIGTYIFTKTEESGKTSYELHIEIDEDAVDEDDAEITGFVQFDSSVKKTTSNGNHDFVISFDDVDLVINGDVIDWGGEEKSENYDLTGSKKGSWQPADNMLCYEVTLSSKKGTPDTILFTDTLQPNGLMIEKLSEIKITDANGEEITAKSQKTKQDADGNWIIELTLPKLEEGEEYLITYKYEITPDETQNLYAKNKMQASSTQKDTGETVRTEREYTVTVSNEYKMQKYYAWTDTTNYKNHWTIDVNANKKNIVGAVLYDDNFDKMSDFTIQPDNGYEIKTDKDGKKYIYFTEVDGTGVNAQSYHITYTTPIDTIFEPKEYVNNAYFDGDGDKKWDVEQEVKKDNVSGGALGKWVADYNDVTLSEDKKTLSIPWKAELTLPTGDDAVLPKGTVIADTMGTYLYMTGQDIKDWGAKLYFQDGTGNQTEEENTWLDAKDTAYDLKFMAEDGTEYTYKQAIKNSNKKVRFVGWSLTLPEDIKIPAGQKKLVVMYRATADVENMQNGETRRLENQISIGTLKATGIYDYKYYVGENGVVKKDGNGNTDTSYVENADGTLTWVVEITTDEQEYEYFDVLDQLPNGVLLKDLEIEFTDSAGGSQKIAVTLENGTLYGTTYNYKASGTYDSDTGKINLRLSKMYEAEAKRFSDCKMMMTYHCKLTQKQLLEGEALELTNRVTVKSDKGEFGDASQTQNWKCPEDEGGKKVILKDGVYDENNKRINYQVQINPKGLDLLKNGDRLTLKDYMEYYTGPYREEGSSEWQVSKRDIILDRSSVKLYYAYLDEDSKLQKGEEVEPGQWSWITKEERKQLGNQWWYSGTDFVTNIIEADIPDEVPLIMEYTYIVDITLANGAQTASVGVKNNVTLEGTYKDDADEIENETYKETSTSGSIIFKKTYTFYKVEKGSYGTSLPNAEFTVYKAGDTESEVRTYQTDADGVFVINLEDEDADGKSLYEEDTLYYVVETKAPEGYRLPDEPKKYYFYFGKENSEYKPDDVYQALNLSSALYSEYVENEKIPTATIEIEKVWKKFGGQENMSLTQTPKTITVVLHQTFADEQKPDDTIVGTYVLQQNAFAVKEGTQTLYTNISSTGTWCGKIENLPKSMEESTCYYWIEEIEINYEENKDYEVAYDQNNAIEEGKIQITNTNNQSYSLPATGGRGTVLYRIRYWIEQMLRK